jgi:hypothetical protein
MNSEDQFEKTLHRQAIKPVPVEWRREILDAAMATALRHTRRNQAETPSQSLRSGPASLLTSATAKLISNLFWPNPKAWAGLAAVWILILMVNFANRESSVLRLARRDAPPSPLMRQLLQQQEQLFAELVGPIEKPETVTPKHLSPGPRSGLKSWEPQPRAAQSLRCSLYELAGETPNVPQHRIPGEV